MKNIISHAHSQQSSYILNTSFVQNFFHETLPADHERHIHETMTVVSTVVVLNLLGRCIATPRFDTSDKTSFTFAYEDTTH